MTTLTPITAPLRLLKGKTRLAILIDYAFIVALLSLAPPDIFTRTITSPIPHADKIVHFCIYAIFAFLMLWTIGKHKKIRLNVTITTLSVLSFGILMEFLQPLIQPGQRFFSIADIGANICGLLTGIAVLLILYRLDLV